LVLAVEANGHNITTIEGLAKDGALSPLQRKFVEFGALQCGFCTPAAVLVATALLKRHSSPTRDQIVEAVDGVLCRCTGYRQIVDAIMDASKATN
jgi:carbon-monoxide dehydrogenase small subunit